MGEVIEGRFGKRAALAALGVLEGDEKSTLEAALGSNSGVLESLRASGLLTVDHAHGPEVFFLTLEGWRALRLLCALAGLEYEELRQFQAATVDVDWKAAALWAQTRAVMEWAFEQGEPGD